MNIITRIFWYVGNILSQIVFAFRIGWRDGAALRPYARPNPIKPEYR